MPGNERPPVMGRDAQSNRAVQLTTSPAENFYPAWSPDGRKVAFVSTRSGNWDLWLMNADGSDQHPLTTAQGLDSAPAWSPDGSMIAFASNRFDSQNAASQLVLMNADGSDPRLVSRNPGGKQLISAWSPGGKALIVLAEPMNELPRWELQLIDTVTTERKTLVKEQVSFSAISWHPDGRSIAFVRSPWQKQEIWTVAPEGTALQPLLADRANNRDPRWSPDGTMLALASDRSGYSEIWLLDLSTHHLRQLSFHQATARYPDWSPDGRTIAFTSNRSGNDQIWILSK
jgi:TolB protein